MKVPDKDARAAVTLRDPRWAQLAARSGTEHPFYYAVETTGIYCRSSCPARLPRPEHVSFYTAPAEAESAGFRPCQRCRPEQPGRHLRDAALVAEACRIMEAAADVPKLAQLAAALGLSRYHLHRKFKEVTGLTPRQYAAAKRAQRVRERLEEGGSVTDAAYAAGFNATSRFYAHAERLLGMKPSDYQAGGTGKRIRFAVGDSSLGAILVAQSERGICAIALGDDPEVLVADLQRRFPAAELAGDDPAFEQVVATVVGFVQAPALGLDLPLDIRGTVFQERVWQALRDIPCGATASYAEIADRVGSAKSVRAVAGACAANMLAVAIPCHRVVRKDGTLSGYRWGVARKRALLDRELAGEQGD